MLVEKRDCGKQYAMKVMDKRKLLRDLGEEYWENILLIERNILSQLHHPLLTNMAYSFQNIDYVMIIMDACFGGDLARFGAYGDVQLGAEEV